MMKTHVGFCIDESGSVGGIVKPLIRAYNNNVDGIRETVLAEGQEASMTSMAFGHRTLKHRILYHGLQVQTVEPLKDGDIKPSGLTPLFDSVYRMIKKLEELDDGNAETTFIISAVTDGQENDSHDPGVNATIAEMKRKIKTDRWTFAFLVPNGHGIRFSRTYGIPQGNIQEWDATSAVGTETAFVTNKAAFTSYFQAKSGGVQNVRSTSRSFYADLGDLTVRKTRSALSEITKQVTFLTALRDCQIREAVLDSGLEWIKGAAFYQLIKTEKKVQDYKLVALRVKTSGKVYCGQEARDMLGIGNAIGTVRLVPGDHGKFDVFIQSTSVNRKIPAGSEVMYWPKVGTQKK